MANGAKNGFGWLIDRARTEPLRVAKHGRPVAVAMEVDEFERLKALQEAILSNTGPRNKG